MELQLLHVHSTSSIELEIKFLRHLTVRTERELVFIFLTEAILLQPFCPLHKHVLMGMFFVRGEGGGGEYNFG